MKIKTLTQTILVITATALLFSGCNLIKKDTADKQQTGKIVATNEAENGEKDIFTGKVTDLLQRGQDVTCTFESKDESTQTSGTVYIAGANENMRGDFTIETDEGTLTNHMIQKDGYSYIWSDAFPQGYKSEITEADAQTPQESSDEFENFDYDQDFDYTCRTWQVDSSRFQEPNDIEFVDLSAQLQQIQETTGDLNQLQCSTCASLTGEAKDACEKALGC